eukprot:scaffold511399_cov17-Prasinocladus_malaysianus.AAC.1
MVTDTDQEKSALRAWEVGATPYSNVREQYSIYECYVLIICALGLSVWSARKLGSISCFSNSPRMWQQCDLRAYTAI